MNRKQFFNILKIVVSISLLTFIFSTIDLRAFLEVIKQANPWWLLAALITMMIGVVLRAFRWRILLEAIGVSVSIGELTAIYFIGFLFNNLLPSGLGGDAIRMLELNVVVDRFLGLSALQAIALVALLTNWGVVPATVAYFTVAIFVGGLVIGYLLINRPLYLNLRQHLKPFRYLTDIKFIGNLFESFQRYPLPALGRSYLVSFLFNITLITMYTFIGWALNAPVSLIQFAIIVPITSLVLLIPISFAGLGVREEAFRRLYGQIGVLPEVAVAMSLLIYIIGNVCTGLVGGALYLWRSARGLASGKEQVISSEQQTIVNE